VGKGCNGDEHALLRGSKWEVLRGGCDTDLKR
jgi:hypothetical protein